MYSLLRDVRILSGLGFLGYEEALGFVSEVL